MNAIEVQQLRKTFDSYETEPLTFNVQQGYITGLIGPNGAGKTTLLRMLMNIVRPIEGQIRIFGLDMPRDEIEIKQRIGFVSDESHFYGRFTMKKMKEVIAPFYKEWDEKLYKQLMSHFQLKENTKIDEASKGMKMKFSIAVALSHRPDLLIMDEPTAGLDPVFRRELLDLLSEWMQDERKTMIYSTHVTTDLDRMSDYVLFMNEGRIVLHEEKDQLFDHYVLVKGDKRLLDADIRSLFIGLRETEIGFEGLVKERESAMRIFEQQVVYERPSLEDIMYFHTRRSLQGGILL
ncbi:ABC transporter ATP-binding protein [Paenibacillus marinisediminis]